MKGYILNGQYATISIENLKSILGDALYHQFAIGTLKYGYRTGEKGERPVFVYSIPMECLSREKEWLSIPWLRKDLYMWNVWRRRFTTDSATPD